MSAKREVAALERSGGDASHGKTPNGASHITIPASAQVTRSCLSEARRFLNRLGADANFAFRTFDDYKNRRDSRLTVTRCGRLEHVGEELGRLNERGAGVYFTVNALDGTGCRAENVTRVRAVFVDLDGAPLGPVTNGPLAPHVIVETSPGRYHVYWCVEDLSLETFATAQRALAERFRGDPSVKDLPRVMRLPGFYHQKREPFLVRVLCLSDAKNYCAEELLAAFNVSVEQRRFAKPIEGTISEGGRNIALTSIAGTMRGRGCEYEEIYALLQVANARRCRPPLTDGEVRAVVQSVMRYPPGKAWWATTEAEDAAADQWLAAVQDKAAARWVGAS